jgi:hypothetical protein
MSVKLEFRRFFSHKRRISAKIANFSTLKAGKRRLISIIIPSARPQRPNDTRLIMRLIDTLSLLRGSHTPRTRRNK